MTPRERVANSGTTVSKFVAPEEFGGAKQDDGSVRRDAVRPAACESVSAQVASEGWTCCAVKWAGGGGPAASRVTRSAWRTSSCVPKGVRAIVQIGTAHLAAWKASCLRGFSVRNGHRCENQQES